MREDLLRTPKIHWHYAWKLSSLGLLWCFFCIGITGVLPLPGKHGVPRAVPLCWSPCYPARFNQVVVPVVAQVYLSPHVRCYIEIQCWQSNISTMCAATHCGPVAEKWLRHRELDNNAVVPGLVDLRKQRGRAENSSSHLTALPCLSVWPFSLSFFFHQFLLSSLVTSFLFPFCCVPLKQSVSPFYL